MKWRSLEEATPGRDTRRLGEIFAERKQLIAKYVPPETQAVHARVISELKEKRLAENILPVGNKAPNFELKDHDGDLVSSRDLLNHGRLVVRFSVDAGVPFASASSKQ